MSSTIAITSGGAVPPKITFLYLVAIYRACSQLLKKRPILFRVFWWRKIDAVLVAHFLLAETEHGAERAIYEERLPF
jgi:hypothetical protein